MKARNHVSISEISPSKIGRSSSSPSLFRSVKNAKMKTLRRQGPHPDRLVLAKTTPPPPLSSTHKQTSTNHEQEDGELLLLVLKPTGLFFQLIAVQVETIFSVFLDFLSMVYETLHRTKEAKESAEAATIAVPARVVRGGGAVLRRLEMGILGASHVFFVLVLALLLAVLAGVGLVSWWAEEPLFLREPLHFDYTEVNPSAVVGIGLVGGGRKLKALPVAHTLHVTVLLLMPESDYNRRIGVFQLTAEAISATGGILAKSSQPCMLRFRSLPVRLIRTLVMAIPFMLGITRETQELQIPILSYKEGYPRTQAIQVHMKAKAGSPAAVPELYAAQLLLNSQLPWSRALVYNWRWTFCVWASVYIYVFFLIILLCFMRPVIFPKIGGRICDKHDEIVGTEQQQVSGGSKVDEERSERGDAREAVRRWRQRRRKRKALLMSRGFEGAADEARSGSTSSTLLTREETGEEWNDSSELGAQESEISSV